MGDEKDILGSIKQSRKTEKRNTERMNSAEESM
jgi:hypothetical protein